MLFGGTRRPSVISSTAIWGENALEKGTPRETSGGRRDGRLDRATRELVL